MNDLKDTRRRGQSGNSCGRLERNLHIVDLAREHTEAAIDALVTIMKDAAVPASARVSAAAILLDRGYGRAPQSLDVSNRLTLSEEFELFVRGMQIDRHAASSAVSESH